MGERARMNRAARATGLAIAVAVHLLFLAAFVLTLKVAGSGREDRAVTVSLLPLELLQRRKASSRPRAAPSMPAPVQAPSPVPNVAGPLPMAPKPDDNLARFGASLRNLFGCQDPDLYHLTAAERARCDARIAKQAKAAPFIAAPMAPDKRAAFDRRVKCRSDYTDAPIPPGLDDSATGGGLRGLGYVPRLRDCPPSDR